MNYYQKSLLSEKSKRLRRHKDRALPISIIVKLRNNTIKYYHGRWKGCKRIHVICDVIVSDNIYSLCGIAKKIIPILENNKSETKCTVCERIHKEIQEERERNIEKINQKHDSRNQYK